MIVICTVCDAEAACCDDSRTLVPGARGAGEVVRVSLHNGSTSTVAKGLSCPEGVALDDLGFLYVVENPVGDECQAEFPTKKAAQLTRIDLRSGAQTRVAGLRSSTTGEEGGPSSHTQTHVRVSICAARTLPTGQPKIPQIKIPQIPQIISNPTGQPKIPLWPR